MAKVNERVRRLANFNIFTSEINPVYFYVILIISMISLFTDYNNMVILKTFTFMLYRMNLYCVNIIPYCI